MPKPNKKTPPYRSETRAFQMRMHHAVYRICMYGTGRRDTKVIPAHVGDPFEKGGSGRG